MMAQKLGMEDSSFRLVPGAVSAFDRVGKLRGCPVFTSLRLPLVVVLGRLRLGCRQSYSHFL